MTSFLLLLHTAILIQRLSGLFLLPVATPTLTPCLLADQSMMVRYVPFINMFTHSCGPISSPFFVYADQSEIRGGRPIPGHSNHLKPLAFYKTMDFSV